MKNILIGMTIIAAALAGLAFERGGISLVLAGLKDGGLTLVQVVPLLAAALLAAGLIQVMMPRAFIEKWLGHGAGIKAVLLGALAGSLVPGGPYVSYPLAASIFIGGAQIGTVMAFISAKNVWTLPRLPMEMALLGVRITFVRYLITFAMPVVVGLLANVLLTGATVEKIREQVRSLAGDDRK